MIGTSLAGVAVDARKVVAVLDRIESTIDRLERGRDDYLRHQMGASADLCTAELTGLGFARNLLTALLEDAEAGA